MRKQIWLYLTMFVVAGALQLGGAAPASAAGYPSNDCEALPLYDGFLDDYYVKLEAQVNQVCIALDDGTDHVGLRVHDPLETSSVSEDNRHLECDLNPSTRIFNEDGAVGPIPFEVEVNSLPGNEVWVCIYIDDLGAAQKRIKIRGAGVTPVVQLDDPAPYPYPEPVSPGTASSMCQTDPGTRTRIVNAVIGGVRAWLYTLQEGGRTHVCQRTQYFIPGTRQGARYTVDGNEFSVDSSNDFSVCGENILTLSTPPLSLKYDFDDDEPAEDPVWICTQVDTTYRRIRLHPTEVFGFSIDT